MKLLVLVALASVAMSLPTYTSNEAREAAEAIGCSKPWLCITKREPPSAPAEASEVFPICPWCITKRWPFNKI
ncbi:hypothetical protein GQ43DRAFT_438345 [Delitschia confertaspora ATCC 74209]|uniref:Uncharacterized protein n=1 Tax=Delitschia confertaspora ATCC 74209 TaxID=1513339 RepID=A0A9P4N1L9_9PLEO|nr:hypothetical protein GQ43DRAFT_438345 [Delitschia confertaspora ATCC 74209]